MQIVLASASPRRKELFSWLGVPFDVIVPEIDETFRKGETPVEYCARISREKAVSVASRQPHSLIVSADTIVVSRGRILGKPRDEDQAREHLRLLQGATHEVYTGYAIIHGHLSVSNVIRTQVRFREMNDEEIAWYISTKEPMDKAGSYGLQGIGSLFISEIAGSYTNVIGLPLSDLYNDLKGFGIALHPIEGG
ncbi:MAG TPA: Maf family protein [Deltaproteobacteria bacterium]|jgi:septum formation protein|nr:Maf family protein [Pseudomonadota bacterium]NLW67644.1 septum formation inhibitor Maf [Bacteriovoracaceae bacterium]HOD70871.1 Maf family protein [Deltaproteobacteria bacterium]HRR19861.1 Maf family protein [Desulfomonilia bacterium]HQM19265.1 Maf family protein [Deltaproteobacteria bacterium]